MPARLSRFCGSTCELINDIPTNASHPEDIFPLNRKTLPTPTRPLGIGILEPEPGGEIILHPVQRVADQVDRIWATPPSYFTSTADQGFDRWPTR